MRQLREIWALSTHTAVIARLDRAIQYAATPVIEPRRRGVLDAPVEPGHDSGASRAMTPAMVASASRRYGTDKTPNHH